jgi:hypothetical protein
VSAQNEPKQEPKAAPKVQMSPGADKSKDESKPSSAQKADPARKETSGQGDKSGQMAPNRPSGPGKAGSDQQGQSGAETKGQAGAGAAGSTAASVNLTAEQRNEVRTTVLQSKNAPKVSNPKFSISVGATVPHTVALVEVHPALVRINPGWRGHRYFIVGDQIIIVDRNFRIVAVLTV